MKKVFATIALVVLAACGGGGSDTSTVAPTPGTAPANSYSAFDGNWVCKNSTSGDFTMSVAFSGVQAAWYGEWSDGHKAYVVYDDKVGNIMATLYYAEKRVDIDNSWNIIWFDAAPKDTLAGQAKGPLHFSVVEAVAWPLTISNDKNWTCDRK